MKFMRFILLIISMTIPLRCSHETTLPDLQPVTWNAFLDTLQVRTLKFFLETTDTATGLTPDRWPKQAPSSVGAVGFALTSYPIAVEHKLITREEAVQRVLNTLTFFWQLPQHDGPDAVGGYKGFYYHFLDIKKGTRYWNCELSTIDTALLLAGALFCQTYFDGENHDERFIRALADSLYLRVDWQWAMADDAGIKIGWWPEQGFSHHIWDGYDEAMILYIFALASPSHPVPAETWNVWTRPYTWARYYGMDFISFGPLFGHQFSHCWIDFRGIQDDYMRNKGIDYFENSRRATYSQRAYAIENPHNWQDYSEDIWGFTACDGPVDAELLIDGKMQNFWTYRARGVSYDWVEDDGTIAPSAVAASTVFAPEICIPALKTMRTKYDTLLWRQYGFIDSFNPSFITPETPHGWFDPDYIGIDQGNTALMLENFHNNFVWNVMKRNPYIIKGLRLAGFSGGWLDNVK